MNRGETYPDRRGGLEQALRMSLIMGPATAIGLVTSVPVRIFTSAILGPALLGVVQIVNVIQKYFGYSQFGLLQGMRRQGTIALGQGDEEKARECVRTALSGNAVAVTGGLVLLWLAFLSGFDLGGMLELWLMIAISILLLLDRVNSHLHTYAKTYGYFDIIVRRALSLRILTPIVVVVAVATLKLQGAILALLLTTGAGILFYLVQLKGLPWVFNFR